MENKTAGIIATVAATLLCGCPGVAACLFGALSAAGLGAYTSDIVGTQASGRVSTGTGIGFLCAGLVLIAIPIVVGFLTLRTKSAPKVDQVPPAS